MSGWESKFVWEFPGGEWGLLLCLVGGFVVIALSYRFTLRNISHKARMVLAILRFCFLIALLACLCSPRMERTRTDKTLGSQKLAVVFDTSTSMTIPGFWKKSRLDNALEFWNNKVKKNSENTTYDFFRFSDKFESVPSLKDIRPHETPASALPVDASGKTVLPPARKTFLYRSINQWCVDLSMDDYSGVICFSDGVDTSDIQSETASKALASTGLRHIFVPVTTELPTRPHALIKRVESITRARVNSDVNVTAVVQYSNIVTSQNLTLTLTDEAGNVVKKENIDHKASSGSLVSRFMLPSKKAGKNIYTLELDAGGKKYGKVVWSLELYKPRKGRRVLLYQGALDWGTRFLKYVFADKLYDLEIRFAPSVFNRNLKGKDTAFPTLDKLNDFDAVILLNLNHKQIDAEMERRLRQFVSDGGGVLFITGNPMMAKEFANSEIEKLLPVEFSSTYNRQRRYDSETKKFLDRVKRRGRHFNARLGEYYWRRQEHKLKVAPLHKFKLTSEGKASPLFTDPETGKPIIPKFQDYAFVEKIKPGATALAQFEDRGKVNVLMAVQRFGFGRSAVMVTDPLWRWKLSYSSKYRYYETFWKNLVSWLGAGRERSCCWNLPSVLLKKNASTAVFFDSSSSTGKTSGINFFLKKNGRRYPIVLSPTKKPGRFKTYITPGPNDNKLELIAERWGVGKKEIAASAVFSAAGGVSDIERTMLKPNKAVLERFTAIPTVKLVTMDSGRTSTGKWFQPEKTSLTRKEVDPLWHRNWIFAVLLGLFLVEMIIRRFFKLV